MNANLGIVLRKGDREQLLSELPFRFRSWGNHAFQEEGPQRFSAEGLEGLEFQLYPVTTFIRGRLPPAEQAHELEYAWVTGPALDTYETWAKANCAAPGSNPVENGLLTLFERSAFWALMFAPEGERLGSFLSVDARGAIEALRRGVSDVSASEGFLAVKS